MGKVYKSLLLLLEMFQKRGQDGVTLTTLILIIIGAVVAVVIILGATGVLNKIFGSSEALPKNLQLVTEACELDAKQTLISDYCYTFKEADDNQYINCQDARVQDALKQQGVAVTGITCDSTLVEDAVKNICTGLSTTQKDKAIFND